MLGGGSGQYNEEGESVLERWTIKRGEEEIANAGKSECGERQQFLCETT